ncbi:short-chain dehydrogenase/reductase [Massariosphaeria phaeospora]|uniref:Short-chain dehydrogenase/reductase n=1 Tax=Massariosphaeria phaeospora TaxID=100035 RepID=A0A7C8I3R7_9PLEO|nr:short-chain dehydrogenase/reductase [Massariosphaeria phaeospora]
MRGPSFNPSKDIPSLAGKVILVTGANTGIGKQTALDLSKHSPAQVWIAARNTTTGNQAVSDIRAVASPQTTVKFLQMDLQSLRSVKSAARTVIQEANRLDILILNAGIMGGEPGVTPDGYEKQFGTNHMGHALLFKLLVPLLDIAAKHRIGAEPRVLSLSSAGHDTSQLPSGGIALSTVKTAQPSLSGITKYCQSKLANAVYPGAAAKRFPQFTIVAVNPGEVKTGLFSTGSEGGGLIVRILAVYIKWLGGGSVEDGAKNSLWCATQEGVQNGAFYYPVGLPGKESQLVKDGELGERLWKWTEQELKGHEL